MLRVHSVETFGTHEGPGIRLVIFLQGCYFRCLYCHNPDTQDFKGGKEYSDEEILEMIEKQRAYFGERGGVTFSGGEPTAQAEPLLTLCKKIKERGVNIALDTNGGIDTPLVRELYQLVDFVLLDVKQMDEKKHRELTAMSNVSVLNLAEYRESLKKPFWMRYVLVPGYTDAEEDIIALGEKFKNYQYLERVEILPYHLLGAYKYAALGKKNPLEGVSSPTIEQVKKVEKIFQQYFKKVIIR